MMSLSRVGLCVVLLTLLCSAGLAPAGAGKRSVPARLAHFMVTPDSVPWEAPPAGGRRFLLRPKPSLSQE